MKFKRGKGRPATLWTKEHLKLIKKFIKNREENKKIGAYMRKIYGYQKFNRKIREF